MTRAILFDLDGTLVDTRTASWQLFSETSLAFALGIDSREEFFRAFEGNFFDSLAKLCPDPARAAAVKAHFMELLRTRYHPALIPGMVDVVRALAPHCTLAVVSTNSLEAIRRILVGADLANCFSHVFSGDVEPHKSVSIRRFLGDHRYAVHRSCSPAYQDDEQNNVALEAQDVVLVTDTVGDIREAREAGVRAIGVTWGMHSERQLLDAGAERVALWPQELVAWLRSSDAPDGDCGCSSTGSSSCVLPAPQHASTPPIPVSASFVTVEESMAEAARLRRERQLHTRLSAGSVPRSGSSRPDGAPPGESELMRSLLRILKGDA